MSKTLSLVSTILLSLVLLSVPVSTAGPGQKQPDKKRTVEIQQALIANGYMSGSPTGKWDKATIDALRGIAEAHKWQVNHVPDARVLDCLHLTNNPDGCLLPSNHLDQAQRGAKEDQ